MALSGYCKKCKRDVPAGELCPYCGSKLGTNGMRSAWVTERTPVKDWMCWNGVARFVLPGAAGIILLILMAEGLSGGIPALEKMFSGGFVIVLGALLGIILLITLLLLALQGKDLQDTVMDGRGIHVTTYLPAPTALKLAARMKPGSLLDEMEGNVVRVQQSDLAWKDVTRVQLWPEKCLILFYAPRGWMRLAVTCTPFTWEDALTLIREKIGKKKNVILPEMLRVRTEKKTPRRAKPEAILIPEVEEAIEQVTLEDVMEEEASGGRMQASGDEEDRGQERLEAKEAEEAEEAEGETR